MTHKHKVRISFYVRLLLSLIICSQLQSFTPLPTMHISLEVLKVGVLFIDFRKAFDSVNHTILLQKLKAVGISGNLLSWMGSYLLNRNQFVQVNEVKSDTSSIKFGVPQGSILGPKLFSLYVNDFPESVTSGELYMFADDTTIFTISDNIDTIIMAM